MKEITLEVFTAFLKQERDVCVTFQVSSQINHTAMYRYQLTEDGRVFEVYTYNHTIYPMCHIDDERNMADIFLISLRSALKMEATSSEDKAKFNGMLN